MTENALQLLSKMSDSTRSRKSEEMSIAEYLELCKTDPLTYATASERMLAAIGEPEVVQTIDDPRLSRIFSNREINRYPAFKDFYGCEAAVDSIVSYFKHSSQGLEEKKQILYLLGPVGGGKSSLAEKLKELMEDIPFYALKANDETCPYFENPLGLFEPNEWGETLLTDFGIPKRYLTGIMGPWTMKRFEEFGEDYSKFSVVKLYPSKLKQVGISKTEPGDENNQDISTLVGKTDIRKLERYSQDDPDSYAFSGGLCKSNQGLLEFVEMFKAPIKVLHPLLTATQEQNYQGTEAISAIPFDGIVLAHSNESEWTTFKANKNNEAFLDRIYIVKVPYCLRVSEEEKIYEKLLRHSSLANAKRAPGTLTMMAQFSVLSRLVEPENSNVFSKMRIYDGESLKDIDPNAKSIEEYRDAAAKLEEGMEGISTRFAFKILSKVFNYDKTEVAANPVHLLYILETVIMEQHMPQDMEDRYIGFIKEILQPKYVKYIGEEIQKCYLESFSEFGQNMFDKYLTYADHWIQDTEHRDPDTGAQFKRADLNAELEKIEKAGGISNPKDFRNEVVNFSLRHRAANGGANPDWTKYNKIKTVIQKRMFSSSEDILPIISFQAKANSDDEKKHAEFVDRMVDKGYSEKQVRLLCDWYIRMQKN